MKRIALLLIGLLLGTVYAFSQDGEFKTLFNENTRIGGFGGPMLHFGSIDGQNMLFTGGGGGLLLNRSFYIGGFGLNSSAQIITEVNNRIFDRVDLSYGGLLLGYKFFPTQPVHVGIDVRVGWGELTARDEGYFVSRYEDELFVASPRAFAAFNLTRWMQVNAGLGYRNVSGSDAGILSNGQLSGMEVSVQWLFGWFD